MPAMAPPSIAKGADTLNHSHPTKAPAVTTTHHPSWNREEPTAGVSGRPLDMINPTWRRRYVAANIWPKIGYKYICTPKNQLLSTYKSNGGGIQTSENTFRNFVRSPFAVERKQSNLEDYSRGKYSYTAKYSADDRLMRESEDTEVYCKVKLRTG